jgi:hypothetical protein
MQKDIAEKITEDMVKHPEIMRSMLNHLSICEICAQLYQVFFTRLSDHLKKEGIKE